MAIVWDTQGSQSSPAPASSGSIKWEDSTTSPNQQEDTKPWYSEGYLGRIATSAAEGAAKLGMSKEQIAATEKAFPKEKSAPEPSTGDALKYMGHQLVEHPLDALGGMAKGLAQDPELLFPGLWEAMPVKMAAAIEKAGAVAKVAETTARGAAVGAAAEATAGYSEGKMDPQKVANTAVLFGIFGGSTRGALEGAKIAWDNSKGAVLKKEEPKSPIDPQFAKSKIRPDETISDVMTRKNEGKKLAQAALRDKQTGEIVPQGAKHDDKLKSQNLDGTSSDTVGEHTPESESSKYNQGFLDGDGNFLDRKQALDRAHKTSQLPKDFNQHDFPEEGLHSGDLRKSGDPNFQTATPPHEAEAIAHNAIGEVDKEVADSMKAEEKDHSSVLKGAAEVVGNALAGIRSLSRRAEIYGRKLKELIPNEGHRDRVTRAIEAQKYFDKIYTDKGKAEALQGMRNGLNRLSNEINKAEQDHSTPPEKLAALVEQQKKLQNAHDKWAAQPSEEYLIPIVKQIEARFKDIGDRAQAAGLIEQLRNNYVTHILDFSKTKMDIKEQQALLDKIYNAPKDSRLVKDFTIERKYEFLRSLEEAVAGTGVVVHTDIATIAEAYEKAMLTAIIHKGMIDHFSNLKAPNGKNYFEPVSTEMLKEGYVPFQGKGTRVMQGLLVHPDLVDIMGHMFNQTDPHIILRALGSITMLTKTLNTVASLFHATNLGIARLTADPVGGMKEIFSGGAGIRAAVDAFKNDENHALIDEFIKSGLMAGSEDIQRTIIADIGQKTDQLLSKFAPKDTNIKLAQHITDPLDKHILQKLNSFTWDYMHTGSKLNLAMNMFEKVRNKNPDMPEEQIRKEVTRFVNNTFGGLNWIDVANQTQNYFLKAFAMKAANMRGRAWGQIMLFAPDWTVSTLRSFTTAIPQSFKISQGLKGMINPTTQADFARRYVLNTAIGYITIQNAINIGLSGHPIWDNKDPTRVDLGDGTSMQVAKHSMEVAEWVREPTKTLGNKLGFFPKSAYIEISGRAYPGPDAPKIKPLYKGYGGMELAKSKAILLQASPFQVSAASQAPEGEGLKRGIMSTLGMPSYGLSKQERAAAIKKGKAEAKIEKKKIKWEDE